MVLFKENHTQLTEVATLDRKSGEAEGSAVRHSGAPNLSLYNHFPSVVLKDDSATTRPVVVIKEPFARRFFKNETRSASISDLRGTINSGSIQDRRK